MFKDNVGLLAVALLAGGTAFGFENTKVLPEGVRSVNVKNVHSTINSKTDKDGHVLSVASPLAKDLTFRNIVNGEEGAKKSSVHAFLNTEGFNLDDALGSFSADMQGRISVVAPIISYGVTDRLTIAIAAPYYRAKTKVELAFSSNPMANKFIAALSSENYNQMTAAQEASDKLGDAVGELQNKLAENGYASLDSWEGAGFGDVTIAAKYQVYDADLLSVATTGGVVAPTGKTSDPDNLIDIPFGSGAWNVFSQVAADARVASSTFVNGYAKYTYQAYGRRDIRLATEDEAIEVEKVRARYKLGDKIETGLSLQYEPEYGLVAGVGLTSFSKYGDSYQLPGKPAAKSKIEGETDQWSRHAEIKLGYSSVAAFLRGEAAVPFAAGVEYKRHLASRYSIVTNLVTADFSMYF